MNLRVQCVGKTLCSAHPSPGSNFQGPSQEHERMGGNNKIIGELGGLKGG